MRFNLLLLLLQLPYPLKMLAITPAHRILYTIDLNNPTKVILEHFLIFQINLPGLLPYLSFYNQFRRLVFLIFNYVAKVAHFPFLNRIIMIFLYFSTSSLRC